MRITKLGHCCLLIEVDGLTILTDPGRYSTKQDDLKDIDMILITHEHSDHLHIDSLKNVLANNPKARVITNNAVKNILEKEKIGCEIVSHGMRIEVGKTMIEGFGAWHAEMFREAAKVENTGYFINDFFYPGDAFDVPQRIVRVLALPVAGPWMKISEAIEYGLEIKPEIFFAVHDGMLREGSKSSTEHAKKFLGNKGIKFHDIDKEPLEY